MQSTAGRFLCYGGGMHYSPDDHEAIDLLCRYLRIDTTNPPGNEIWAARFLGEILERGGIPYSIHESQPGRACLVARLKGDGSQGPLLLLNHMDVVGVERGAWSVDPFGGVVKDGCIWGRGALDMKGMGMMQLVAMIRAQRAGLPLTRDLIFLAVADEETNGSRGAKWFVENYPEEVAVEFVLNEGSLGISDQIDRPLFPISTAEKGPVWMRVTTRGEAGHGSMPPRRHAAHRLTVLLERLISWRQEAVLTPEVASFLTSLGEYMRNPVAGWLIRHASSAPVWALLKRALRRNKGMRSMLANSLSINMVRAGQKENVVPSRAEAVVDCRLLPDVDPQDFLKKARRRMRASADEVETLIMEAGSRSPAPTALFEALEYGIRRAYPDALVTQILSSGFSDSRFFRRRGVTAYGIIPILVKQGEVDGIHGHDERIPITSYIKGIDIILDTIRYLNGQV